MRAGGVDVTAHVEDIVGRASVSREVADSSGTATASLLKVRRIGKTKESRGSEVLYRGKTSKRGGHVKSLADKVIRLEHEPSGASQRRRPPRGRGAVHLHWGRLPRWGGGWESAGAEAAPVTTESELSQRSPPQPVRQPRLRSPRPRAPAPDPASVRDSAAGTGTAAAAAPKIRKRSALLRTTPLLNCAPLRPKAIAGQPNAEHDLGTFFALGIEVPRGSGAGRLLVP